MMPRRAGLIALFALLLLPAAVLAEGHAPEEQHHLTDLPIWSVVPFAGLLLSIAILPLVAGHFWHSNRNRGLVTVLFSLPIIAYLYYLERFAGQPGLEALAEGLKEYAAFICLLGSLYVVSGGIVCDINARPTPLVNGLILLFGAALANLIGTTGSSMLLIRPYLRINKVRQNVLHLPIFFIFMVSNLGGLLTPLGDPPLFLGFLNGISFFWTMQLWPQWLMANGIVLSIFMVWDTVAYLRDPGRAAIEPPMAGGRTINIQGLVNSLFFVGILAAVLFQSREVTEPIQLHLSQYFDCPDLQLMFPIPELVMIGMAVFSLYFTRRGLRSKNGFGWGAIIEVAVLFVGIFITMVPALALLQENGHEFQNAGLNQPWHYFWLTGSLSAFLDNAPTYKTFASLLAGGPDFAPLMTRSGGAFLVAISCGAVFMGAMTYIGNGPNFMVKAISDEQDYRTPSFFGYLIYSSCILLPVFVIITFVFFPPGTSP
jgi:Na+/H+ antiporter NhaD/arsenite permease-like protein